LFYCSNCKQFYNGSIKKSDCKDCGCQLILIQNQKGKIKNITISGFAGSKHILKFEGIMYAKCYSYNEQPKLKGSGRIDFKEEPIRFGNDWEYSPRGVNNDGNQNNR